MYAVRDAEPRAGVRYPLVLRAPGRDTALGAERSVGVPCLTRYVVCLANPVGVELPPPFETVSAEQKPAILDGHVAHLRFALAWLAGQDWVDASRVRLLVGLSASGLTAAPYAGAASLEKIDEGWLSAKLGITEVHPWSASGMQCARGYERAARTLRSGFDQNLQR